MLRGGTYLFISLFLVILSLPARFAGLRWSLWLDEAWVANSVMDPSMREVFFSRAWTQSSPPLFLLLERFVVALAGSSEIALRLLPSFAALAGILLTAYTLQSWVSKTAALLCVTLLCANYSVIKYSQQVKQYGTDLFVSALLLFLLGRFLGGGQSRKSLWTMLVAGAGGLFLSYTTAFWLSSILLAAAVPGTNPAAVRPWPRIAAAACLLGSALLFVMLVFVEPNRNPVLVKDVEAHYLDISHPLNSLVRFCSALGLLLVPITTPALFIGFAVFALMLVVVLSAIFELRARSSAAVMLLLGGALPWACVITASALKLYPILDYPRLLIFAIPSLLLLLGRGVDLLLVRLLHGQEIRTRFQAPLVVACLAIVVLSQFIYFSLPRPTEENRPALALVQESLMPADLLFVHPGMYEQFRYYRHALSFQPTQVYVGNVQWPCCATGDREKASSPFVSSLAGDLREAASQARGHNLWLFFPAGSDGHWSFQFRAEIEAASHALSQAGCRQTRRKLFGQTLVECYQCE